MNSEHELHLTEIPEPNSTNFHETKSKKKTTNLLGFAEVVYGLNLMIQMSGCFAQTQITTRRFANQTINSTRFGHVIGALGLALAIASID